MIACDLYVKAVHVRDLALKEEEFEICKSEFTAREGQLMAEMAELEIELGKVTQPSGEKLGSHGGKECLATQTLAQLPVTESVFLTLTITVTTLTITVALALTLTRTRTLDS